MTTRSLEEFETMTVEQLATVEGGGATRIAPGMYCWDEPGKKVATCRANLREVGAYTGKTIVNGWVKYGPWAPRP